MTRCFVAPNEQFINGWPRETNDQIYTFCRKEANEIFSFHSYIDPPPQPPPPSPRWPALPEGSKCSKFTFYMRAQNYCTKMAFA